MRTLWKRPKRPITWWNWKQETGKWNCVSSPTAPSCKLQACLPFHWIYIARTYARPFARPYVRVYIYCVSSFPLCFPLKNHVLQPVCQSVIYEKVLIFLIKKALYIWCVFPNPLLLHPLSRTGAAIVWHSDRNGVGTLPFFLLFGAVCFMNTAFKKKNEKNFRFIWSIWNKVLTFAPAFKMRAALFDNLFEIRAVTTVLFLCSSFRKRDDLKKEKNKKKLPKIFGRY